MAPYRGEAEDVEDTHRAHRLLECAVARGLPEPPHRLDAFSEAARKARGAARESDGTEWARPASTSTGNRWRRPAATA
ncbi:hypothetical protein GCM10027162_25190 [Streptomyces incanus]